MIDEVWRRYPELSACRGEILRAVELLRVSFQNGGKLLLCGNGGSCSDCEHITGELMKGFLSKRPLSPEDRGQFAGLFGQEGEEMAAKLQNALPAIPLPSLNSVISAFSNDVDPDLAYAQMVWGYGKPGDVLLGISTSGNAKNVVSACMAASARGMDTIGLTGDRIGQLDRVCGLVIHAPRSETYQIQELHLPIYHAICAAVEEAHFGAGGEPV